MAIIIKPLTATDIKNATPEKSPLRDGEGLFLDITSHSKKWRLDYKRPITKKRTSITLGDYPTLSLKEVREKRAELRALLAQGIDPREHQQRKQRELFERMEGTFYKVACEWKGIKANQVMPQTLNLAGRLATAGKPHLPHSTQPANITNQLQNLSRYVAKGLSKGAHLRH